MDDAIIPMTIPVKHPLAGFTCLITPFEYGTVDTYYRFEVPKKGGAEKSIIFHALDDMDRGEKHTGESSSNASCGVSESQCPTEDKLICEGMKKDFGG